MYVCMYVCMSVTLWLKSFALLRPCGSLGWAGLGSPRRRRGQKEKRLARRATRFSMEVPSTSCGPPPPPPARTERDGSSEPATACPSVHDVIPLGLSSVHSVTFHGLTYPHTPSHSILPSFLGLDGTSVSIECMRRRSSVHDFVHNESDDVSFDNHAFVEHDHVHLTSNSVGFGLWLWNWLPTWSA